MSSHPILGYFFEPWRQLRIARDNIGEPLLGRLGNARLLTIVVTKNSLEPAVLSLTKGEPVFQPLPSIPSNANADALLDKSILTRLRSESGSNCLAVTFARMPEQTSICRDVPEVTNDYGFHTLLTFSPERVRQNPKSNASANLIWRGFRHPTAPVALVAGVDSNITKPVREAAANAGMTVMRCQVALIQLADIGLRLPAVRNGGTLMVLDHGMMLCVTSTAQGVWEDVRVRLFSGEQDLASQMKSSNFLSSLKGAHHQNVSMLDTKTSGDIDLAKLAEGSSLKLTSASIPNGPSNCLTHASLLAA